MSMLVPGNRRAVARGPIAVKYTGILASMPFGASLDVNIGCKVLT
jgi:hypothetical protein